MRALIVSGGGSRGAYAAGAMQYLTNELGHEYDLYTGISVGALNSAYVAQFNNSATAANNLVNFWRNVKQKDIYRHWYPFFYLHALWKKSVYNSKSLWKLVDKNIKLEKVQGSGKKVSVGAVCLNTGEYKIFTEKDDDFIKGSLASSAFPGAFCPIKIDGKWWVDGGVRHLTPIKTAIDRGATELDIIITSRTKPKNVNNTKSTYAIPLAFRSLKIMREEILESDLKLLQLYNELVKNEQCTDKKYIKYNIIRPKSHLVENILEFKQNEIRKNINLGWSDAQKIFI